MLSQGFSPFPALRSMHFLLQYLLALFLFLLTTPVAADGGPVPAVNIIAGVACIIVGLFLAFFGFRFFRPILFLVGFISFGLVTYIICINVSPITPEDTTKRVIYLVLIIVLGLIGGILMAIFWRVALFLVGLLGGFFLSMFILSLAPNGLIPEPLFRSIFIVLLSIICSFLIFKFERPVVIISTAIIGAFLFILGVDLFAHAGFSDIVTQALSSTGSYSASGRTYGMIAGLAITAILGMIVQFSLFKGLFRRDKSAYNTSNRADNV